RFMLARSMDELLAFAPRFVVSERLDMSSWKDPDENTEPGPLNRDPVFDDDAAAAFSRLMPLTRLVEASTSTRLPPRLRLRVASAAFTRAALLNPIDDALKIAPVLRALSPSAAAVLLRFRSAAPPDPHLAGPPLP